MLESESLGRAPMLCYGKALLVLLNRECVTMKRLSAYCLLVLMANGFASVAMAKESGEVVYSAGNCFILQTKKGATLFERSGGQSPKVGQPVRGVLHDFGYQQLYDGKGKELMVGFVQEFGVKKEASLAAFKKSCR